jgi:hypothetical protein
MAAHHRTARIINGVGTHRRRRWGSLRRPPVERIFPA